MSQSASGARGKSGALRLFLPVELYKSTRRKRLNLYRCLLTPNAGPTWTSSNDATVLIKILLQRGIPLHLAYDNVIWWKTHNVRLFTIYWHKRCSSSYILLRLRNVRHRRV